MLCLELNKICVVIVYVPLLWICLRNVSYFFSISTLSFQKFHVYNFFFWQIELELFGEWFQNDGRKLNTVWYFTGSSCVFYTCIYFDFGFIMTFKTLYYPTDAQIYNS